MSFSNEAGCAWCVAICAGRHCQTACASGFRPSAAWHWRRQVVAADLELPSWLHHCEQPMFLLSRRASQAASQIDAEDRLRWLVLNCCVSEHALALHLERGQAEG